VSGVGGPSPRWLTWAREVQTLAQTGLNYAKDPYDAARYRRLLAIAAEMMSEGSDLDVDVILSLFAADRGHPTPKVDVRAKVFRDDAVMLVRERSDGLWTLPGGWADPGEAPSAAAERETHEESGYLVQATRLLAVYDRDRRGHPPMVYSVYKVYFGCEIVGGAPADSTETDGVSFFRVAELPPLSLPRITPDVISRLYEIWRRADRAPDFD
jgi:ADP-ribose pyrophosphatase YjhB (NUDIX family)